MTQLWTRFQQTRGWRAWTRFGDARGNLLAAGIAFYGFFSIFPAAAIAAVVFGFVLRNRPDLLVSVGDSLNATLPGFVRTAAHPDGLVELVAPKISVLTIGGLIAVVGLVLSGLGWVGSLRDGIRGVFGVAGSPGNVVTVKLRDLGVLVTFGLAVLVSAVLTSLTGAASGLFTAALGEPTSRAVVMVVGLVLGFVVDTAIMIVLLRVLSGIPLPWRDIRGGAVVGGVGLTVVKAFGVQLIANATKNPLFGSIVLVIGLLFWLNLIAKLVLYAASWSANDVDRGAGLVDHGGAQRVVPSDEQTGARAGARAHADRSGPAARAAVRAAGADLLSTRGRAIGGVPAFGERTVDRTSIAAGAVLGATVALALGSVGRVTRAVLTRR